MSICQEYSKILLSLLFLLYPKTKKIYNKKYSNCKLKQPKLVKILLI